MLPTFNVSTNSYISGKTIVMSTTFNATGEVMTQENTNIIPPDEQNAEILISPERNFVDTTKLISELQVPLDSTTRNFNSGDSSTTRVSVSSNGIEGNDFSFSNFSAISSDGRFVVFDSSANNLVANDTNGFTDVFIRDRQTGITTLVSVDSNGIQGNSDSSFSSISASGRFVVFESSATNLVQNDTNGVSDIFIYDQQTGSTSRVSVDSDGNEANGLSTFAAVSDDGRFVTFSSSASNLVVNDTNGVSDIFIRDIQTGTTSLVSVDSNGNQANSSSDAPAISTDGRFITFTSSASNLVPDDTNGFQDIFIRDQLTGTTSLVSISSDGVQQNDNFSFFSDVSSDGRFVVFDSDASNLVASDTNGSNDIFIRDQLTGTTSLVSVSSTGIQGDNFSSNPNISADGRFVTFESFANNLVANDDNFDSEIFIFDRLTATTSLVSVDSNGNQGIGVSTLPSISTNGQFVVFTSDASNLVANDTNDTFDVFVFETLNVSALNNFNFETGDFTNWSTIGDTSVENEDLGVIPTSGLFQALISNGIGTSATDSELESFLALTPGTLDNFGNGNATQGSAIQQTFTANEGDTLTFDWNFLTNEETPSSANNDFAFYTIDLNPAGVELADTTSPDLLSTPAVNFIEETGYQTATITIPQSGTYTLGFGVVDTGDDIVNSGLLVDNVTLIRNQTPPSSILNGGFEFGNFIGFSTRGNRSILTAAFGSGPSEGVFNALLTSGTGSVDGFSLESFLGAGTTGAAEGSALKTTFTANAGQVLSFDWNFLTNEGIPSPLVNDFSLVTIRDDSGLLLQSTLADTFSLFGTSSTGVFGAETGFNTFSFTIPTTGAYTLGIGVADVDDTAVDSGLLVDNIRLS
jgi:hypothetical protein